MNCIRSLLSLLLLLIESQRLIIRATFRRARHLHPTAYLLTYPVSQGQPLTQECNMSKQAKDAPNEPDAPRTPAVSSGVQTSQDAAPVQASGSQSETTLPSGDTIVVSHDEMGTPVEVVDVKKED